jgi:hypothetical protein
VGETPAQNRVRPSRAGTERPRWCRDRVVPGMPEMMSISPYLLEEWRGGDVVLPGTQRRIMPIHRRASKAGAACWGTRLGIVYVITLLRHRTAVWKAQPCRLGISAEQIHLGGRRCGCHSTHSSFWAGKIDMRHAVEANCLVPSCFSDESQAGWAVARRPSSDGTTPGKRPSQRSRSANRGFA